MHYHTLKNVIKMNKIILMLGIILICFGIQTKCVKAEENNIIKVGSPLIEGSTEVKDGVYSGYVYEYLKEIAKHTGWEYEFIEMNLNDLIYQLRDGKIDIAVGMLKNDQNIELYDFPEYNAGYAYTTLSVLKDNKNISQSNYNTLNGLKVGYFETSKVKLNNFIKFCEINGINNIDLISYPHQTGTELSQALKSKEVDAIINGDSLLNSDERVILKFGVTPYYFATTKGNTKIISELNKALSNIKESDTNFDQRLYNKYFKIHYDHSFNLTQDEQDYISNMAPLKALYIDNYIPLHYYDSINKKPQGICIDLIDLIVQKSGLRFELVPVKTSEEAYQLIKDKKADLIISVPSINSLADANEFTLTKSYLELDIVQVVRKNKNNKENEQKIVALSRASANPEINSDYKVNYYYTLGECLDAIEKGKADLCYGNSYSISDYLATGYYPNLTIISNNLKLGAAFGLAKPTDKNLMSIINKAIYSLSEEEIKDVIYLNTINIKHPVTLKQFFFDNLALCITVIIFILTSISILIYIIVRIKFKNLKTTKLLLLKKSQIDSLTGLYNREACKKLITDYLNIKNSLLYGAFIIIDIDYFKQINDSFGHKIGDDLLKEFSEILQETFSNEDAICRLGGDEFIVFMKDIEKNNLQIITQRLQAISKLMYKEIIYNGCSQKISLSIGAVIIKQAINFNDMYEKADEMLYKVKRNGRNGFEIHNYF